MATNYASEEIDGDTFECRVIPVFRRKRMPGFREIETDEIAYQIARRKIDGRSGTASEWSEGGQTYSTPDEARAELPRGGVCDVCSDDLD